MDGGSDRSPGRGVVGRQVLLPGWGGAALAGDVCCHWSPGSGRLLPLGTSPTGGRERRGGPSWPPGPALQWAAGREAREEEAICVHTADSRCAAETNTTL